jgi:ankyrin repeat protein
MKMRRGWLLAALCGVAVAQAAELARAAEQRDFARVRALLEQKADVNAAQADGTTALHWAVHWNDVDTVQRLLRAGANPRAVNRLGASPLSEAAALGSAALIRLLLDAGADARTLSTPDGETVLMTAARAGNLEAVKLLVERGADVNAREQYKGQTALMWAAAERHADVVAYLLAQGADWRVKSFEHETKMPKLSAASSVTPMARGGLTALSFAAREGHIPTLEALLKAGADINLQDGEKTTPLVTAILNKEYTAAKYLLDHGADPNLADSFGRAALYAAIDMRNEDYSALPRRPLVDTYPSIRLIEDLIVKGADVNQPLVQKLPGRSGMDSGDTTLGEGATPLMRAARAGDGEVIRLLLRSGADPNARTKEGNTALLFAAGVGYRDKNTTGTEAGALEAVKLLTEVGQSLAQTNNRGETALHGAASRGADTIVKYLAAQKADLNARARTGFTPLDVAMGKGSFGLPVPYPSTVALLRELGAKEGKDLPPPPGAKP